MKSQLEKALAHEDAARAGTDAEAIHDMRVATRRLRAALRLFNDYYRAKQVKRVRPHLRELASYLGEVRDLDVLIEHARQYASELSPERQQALEVLLADWYAQRVAAHQTLVQFLDSREYQQWTARMKDFVKVAESNGAAGLGASDGLGSGEGLYPATNGGSPSDQQGAKTVPARDDEPRVLDELPVLVWQHYGVLRRYEDRIEGAPLDTLHELRMEGKQLRYTLEFFEDVLDCAVPELLELLVALQDHLGELHDADVARLKVVDFLIQQTRRIASLADTAALQEATAYLSALQSRIAERHAKVMERWEPVIAPEFRLRLAEAVAGL